MTPTIAAISDAVNTTATRPFDELVLEFPRDEYMALYREFLMAEALQRTIGPTDRPPFGAMELQIRTALGVVRIVQAKEEAT